MPVPSSQDEFFELVRKSGLVEAPILEAFVQQLGSAANGPLEPKSIAVLMVRNALLTAFQAEQLLQGKYRGFTLGKYLILERVGSGGMGIVYLCKHKFMQRPVAVKVLPASLASDPWFLKRFYEEAQAVAALDHPNIVRAYDIDQDAARHFIVMEYVDGANLQEIVSRHGPLSVERAANYILQAARGMQHAHSVGMVHRDIKPGNVLLNRTGQIKLLDMGLARFYLNNRKDPRANKDTMEKMVGTDDYLPPEQVVDSGSVDIRADIYGLGATFYFLLTGKTPFQDVELAHLKLVAHLTRTPKPVSDIRFDVPEELAAILARMMAKNPWDRYQTPADIVDALSAWAATPIAPPPEAEMPKLSPLALRSCSLDGGALSGVRMAAGGSSILLRSGSAVATSSSNIHSRFARAQAPTPTGNTTRQEKPKITIKPPDPVEKKDA